MNLCYTYFMSSSVSEAACQEQFASAVRAVNRFVHASDADDYYFGGTVGLGTLHYLPDDVERPAVLDIGAGYGTFLEAALDKSPRDIRAIGLVAVDARRCNNSPIEWVFGDFQRPQTWNPKDTLRPDSIDLAVSSLTFMHFADPIRGLRNALNLLKPGGHLFIDNMRLPVTPEHAPAVSELVIAGLQKNPGGFDFHSSYNENRHLFNIFNLHLQRQAETGFERLHLVGDVYNPTYVPE